MVSPTSQLPSMVQSILSPSFGFAQQQPSFGPQALSASPFGAAGGFPPLGAFNGIGSQQILSQVASGIPGLPQGFMVGGPNLGGIPSGGGQFQGFVQPQTGGAGLGVQPQLFSQQMVAPLGIPGGFGGNLATSLFGPPVGAAEAAQAAQQQQLAALQQQQQLAALQQQQQLAALQQQQQLAQLQQQQRLQQTQPLPQTQPLQQTQQPQPGQQPQTALPPATGDSSQQVLGMFMQLMMMMLTLMLKLLSQNQGVARDLGPATQAALKKAAAGGAGNAGNAGNQTFAAVTGNTGITNVTRDANQKNRLDGALAKIAADPDGAKLLAAAKAKGYTIEVGDPSAAGARDQSGAAHDVATCPACQAALDAGQQVNGVTLSGSQKKIVINPNAPNFEKTIAHELVHAATDGDGNSLNEEGYADVVGSMIANRIGANGLTGSDQQIFQNKIRNYLGQGLAQNNGVRNDLLKLGITDVANLG